MNISLSIPEIVKMRVKLVNYFLVCIEIKYKIYSLLLGMNDFEKFQLCGLITSEPFGGKIQEYH
jgi:hypothetical protein